MNRAMRSTVLDEMSRDELEPVVERALMSGNREVADAVWRRWRQLAEPAGAPLPADVVEHLDAVAAELRRRVETWQAERIEQAAARLRAVRPSEYPRYPGYPALPGTTGIRRPPPPGPHRRPDHRRAGHRDGHRRPRGRRPAGGPAPPVAVPTSDRAAPRFAPRSQDDLAPSGAVARVRANLAALRMLRALQAEGRPATADEQAVLARWSGWGAVPEVFDERRLTDFACRPAPNWRQLLSRRGVARGRADHPQRPLHRRRPGRSRSGTRWRGSGSPRAAVLEPGCGSGNFIGARPGRRASWSGSSWTRPPPRSPRAVPARADPGRVVRRHPRIPAARFDLVVGNVPFAKVALHDTDHNPRGHTIHNHFIVKSLHLTAPAGWSRC